MNFDPTKPVFTFHVDDDSIHHLAWADAVDLAAATPFTAITKDDLTFAVTDARGRFHLLTPPVVTVPSLIDLADAAALADLAVAA